MSRRGFLRAGLTVTAGGAVSVLGARPAAAEECADGIGTIPPEERSIQLFTLTAAMTASPGTTLAQLYEIGYRHVEHAGFGMGDAASFRQAMDDAGPEHITSPTGHTAISHPFDHDQVMGLIEDAHVTGTEWLINPSASFETEQEWVAFAETINLAGALAQDNGLLGAGHHNHTQEYTPFGEGGDRRPADVLLEACDPEVTSQEMDLCWVWSSETDPVEYLERYPGRYRWFHVKDMNEVGQPTFPGLGVIDFDRIFEAAARTQQIDYYIIEQDAAPTGFETAQLGWDLLADARFACPPPDTSGEPRPSGTAVTPDTSGGTTPSRSVAGAAGTTDADSGATLPNTGGGLATLGLAALGGALALRRRVTAGPPVGRDAPS